MPLLIVDYVREDYTILHNGLLRRFLEQDLKYVEGQILEVYEGWLGRERVRVVNARLTAIYDYKRILLPLETVQKYGIAPRTWIVFSALRVGDPKREVFYPVYPGRVVPYVPARDILAAMLEELMLKQTGLASYFASIVYRAAGVLEDLKRVREREKASRV